MTKDDSIEVIYEIDEDGVRHSECLYAEQLGTDTYRLLSPPGGAWWLGVGDIVRCRPPDENNSFEDRPMYVELIRSAGHQTVSIWFAFESIDPHQKRITMLLKEAGFNVHESWGREILIDVKTAEEIQALEEFLGPHRQHIERFRILGPPKEKVQ